MIRKTLAAAITLAVSGNVMAFAPTDTPDYNVNFSGATASTKTLKEVVVTKLCDSASSIDHAGMVIPSANAEEALLAGGQDIYPVDHLSQVMDLLLGCSDLLPGREKPSCGSFEVSKEGLDLADVMIAVQKSSVSFKAMVEVRNKLVDAYKDVMNMPV